MDKAQRDANGRFEKGTPSPNPKGRRGKKEPRRFTSDQLTKDFMELLDEPIMVRGKDGKETEMPTILAIYRKMVNMAAGGNWQAIKKTVELREKYVNQRTEVLLDLLSTATKIRESYSGNREGMPDDAWDFVDKVEQMVGEMQYRGG
jgi:hypothetical protein